MSRCIAIFLFALAGLTACQGPGDEQKIPDERVIVARLHESAQLATVEYVLNKVVMGKKTNSLLGFTIGESSFLAETQATVKAGVDLSKLQPEDVSTIGQSIIVKLPPVEILNFSYPAERFKINKEYTQNDWFAEISQDEIDQFYQEAQQAIRKDLAWMGIEEAAEKKTRRFLENFLLQAGYEEVYIEFQKGPTLENQPLSQPALPK
ncbi:MAG: DUF4230 domain-containing protein [Bacteroidota bacterium]